MIKKYVKMKNVAFLAGFLLLLSGGCKSLKDLANSIQKPTLSVTDVRVTDFNFNEIELTYDVQVNNPNPVVLQMLSYDYDLKINQNDFLKGDENKKLRIASSGSSTFQLPMRLNFQQLYNLFSGLRDKDEADYNMAANLDFDLPVLGKTTLPLHKKGSLPMIKLPKISVANIQVQHVSLSKADILLNLQMDNPNGFGVLLNQLSYDFNVNGKNWVEGNKAQQLTVGGHQTSQIQLPISLSIAKIGTSLIQLLNNSSNLNYTLKGSLNAGTTLPLLGQTTFNFDRSGQVQVNH